MTTKYDLLKNIEKSISLPSDKKIITYFLDKTIIKSWTIDDKKETCYVRILIDFMFYIKAQYKETNTIIPVDVLMELKEEGMEQVSQKSFKKWVSLLAKVMIVNPDVELEHFESVQQISNVYTKAGYKSCIITLNKELYKEGLEEGTLIVTPKEIILSIILTYGIGIQQLKNIIDEWLEDDFEEKDGEKLTNNNSKEE